MARQKKPMEGIVQFRPDVLYTSVVWQNCVVNDANAVVQFRVFAMKFSESKAVNHTTNCRAFFLQFHSLPIFTGTQIVKIGTATERTTVIFPSAANVQRAPRSREWWLICTIPTETSFRRVSPRSARDRAARRKLPWPRPRPLRSGAEVSLAVQEIKK